MCAAMGGPATDVEPSRLLELLGVWLGTTAWDTGEARGALHDLGLVVLRPVIGARPQPVYASVKRIFLIQSDLSPMTITTQLLLLSVGPSCFRFYIRALPPTLIDAHHTTDASLHTDVTISHQPKDLAGSV